MKNDCSETLAAEKVCCKLASICRFTVDACRSAFQHGKVFVAEIAAAPRDSHNFEIFIFYFSLFMVHRNLFVISARLLL